MAMEKGLIVNNMELDKEWGDMPMLYFKYHLLVFK